MGLRPGRSSAKVFKTQGLKHFYKIVPGQTIILGHIVILGPINSWTGRPRPKEEERSQQIHRTKKCSTIFCQNGISATDGWHLGLLRISARLHLGPWFSARGLQQFILGHGFSTIGLSSCSSAYPEQDTEPSYPGYASVWPKYLGQRHFGQTSNKASILSIKVCKI